MTLSTARTSTALWRVGHAPEPWAWPEWEYAGDSRWDDAQRRFHTIYAAESPTACYLELLARFRPDPAAVAVLDSIDVDPEDDPVGPTAAPGLVPTSWADARRLTSGVVDGIYCDVTATATIAQLRTRFLTLARDLGMTDLDAAALKTSESRALTQSVATWIYQQELAAGHLADGIAYASRFGDEHRLWALFERPGDRPISRRVTVLDQREIRRTDPELLEVFALHRLTWDRS